MHLSRSKRALVLATTAVALLGAGVSGGIALAAADNVRAPYARAAVTVNDDGSIVRSKGIDTVTRLSDGRYCVKLNPGVDPNNAVFTTASHRYRLFVVTELGNNPDCGDDPQSIRVTTTDHEGTFADGSFSLVVH
ncbi:hypothetical protein [Streptomyces sp. NPDC002209]|uniref:hypothetical protein n=1 Tax=Streptomyces sp. NPDC002209 TaxID=3364638 RepID=UPI0036C390F7